jgi:sortase A
MPPHDRQSRAHWAGESSSRFPTPRFAIAAVSGRRRPQTLVAIWFVAVVAGMALVIYGFGPYFQQRSQRHLLRAARADISRAANEATGLEGVTVPTKAVAPGTPVGIVEIGAVKMQQVVVEGVGPSQTRAGPGHVPGTAGLGQPGNSVVVGRRAAFGGPFSSIGDLRKGKPILVTTNQGQSVYRITSVRHVSIHGAGGGRSSTIDRVYGKSPDDRLTLVTSANSLPSNESSAVVVVAKMDGTAFAPTPQGARLDSDIGTQRDSGATASIVLALFLYGLTISASVLLYKRLQPRTAYLLTIGPILAMTIVAAETLSRAFPAWV